MAFQLVGGLISNRGNDKVGRNLNEGISQLSIKEQYMVATTVSPLLHLAGLHSIPRLFKVTSLSKTSCSHPIYMYIYIFFVYT
jgi:hypothetical protein